MKFSAVLEEDSILGGLVPWSNLDGLADGAIGVHRLGDVTLAGVVGDDSNL